MFWGRFRRGFDVSRLGGLGWRLRGFFRFVSILNNDSCEKTISPRCIALKSKHLIICMSRENGHSRIVAVNINITLKSGSENQTNIVKFNYFTSAVKKITYFRGTGFRFPLSAPTKRSARFPGLPFCLLPIGLALFRGRLLLFYRGCCLLSLSRGWPGTERPGHHRRETFPFA